MSNEKVYARCTKELERLIEDAGDLSLDAMTVQALRTAIEAMAAVAAAPTCGTCNEVIRPDAMTGTTCACAAAPEGAHSERVTEAMVAQLEASADMLDKNRANRLERLRRLQSRMEPEGAQPTRPYVSFDAGGVKVDLARYLKTPEGQAAVRSASGSGMAEGAQGAVACHRWIRGGAGPGVAGEWIDGAPSERELVASREIRDATWAVQYAYTTPPQPQDAARDIKPDGFDAIQIAECQDLEQLRNWAGCMRRERDNWRRDAQALAEQLARDREDAGLQQLSVLADIRKAIGDDGKLMQDELVEAIAKLAEDAKRYRWLRKDAFWETSADGYWLQFPAVLSKKTRRRKSNDDVDRDIDAARGAGGGGS